jgi:hypothetical protein
MKFINELDAEKIFIRHFLDSIEKSKIIFEKFQSIRILNLKVKESVELSEQDHPKLEHFNEFMTPIISFYSNLNKCRTVDITPIVETPNDFQIFRQVSDQIKTIINPLLIVVLGNERTIDSSREFAEKINFEYINSSDFYVQSQVESYKYFADALNKHIFRTKNENIFLHLDVEEFHDQWQILLFSLKPIIKSIFLNESFNKLNINFFKEYSFQGKLIEYTDFNFNLQQYFFKSFKNQFIVFDEDFPFDLNSFIREKNFLVLDCKTISNVISQKMTFQGISPSSSESKEWFHLTQ